MAAKNLRQNREVQFTENETHNIYRGFVKFSLMIS